MYKKFIYQILFVMRLTIVVLILGIMQVSAISFAQKVTYVKKQATLEEIFEVIRVQTGYNVFYSSNKIDDSKKMDVRFKDAELKAVLDLCAEKQSLAYTIEAKNIFFKAKEKNIVDKIISLFSAIDVKGKVMDENGQPLQGASVKVKGTTLATMTDTEGEFVLRGVPEDAVIVIGFLGYRPQELKASGNVGLVKMELATSDLKEVTVSTGYWSTSKRLSTGNISKVTTKEISGQPVVSPLLALQGRVAGLEITIPGNATPGVAPKIRIRGNNSLRVQGKGVSSEEGNFPLYVIDGVPVTSSPISSVGGSLTGAGYDPLSTINPENIESIEVLKDADATAIYGSRGANGIILITTKNKNLATGSFELSVYKGMGQVTRKFDLLNTEQYLSMRKEAIANDGRPINQYDVDLKFWDQERYTDWQEVLLGGTAGILDYQASASGGNSYTSFRFGGSYHKETSIFTEDRSYQRISGQLGINHTSKDQKFKLGVITNYGVDMNKVPASNLVGSALTLPPNAPKLYNDDGTLNWEIRERDGVFTRTWENPVAGMQATINPANYNLVFNSISSYELFPGFLISNNVGYSNFSGNERSITPISSKPPADILNPQVFGSAIFTDTRRQSWILEPRLSYSRKIHQHTFDIMIGTSWQKQTNRYTYIAGDRYGSDALVNTLKGAGQVRVVMDDASEYKYASLYGRIGYNWKQRYLLNITGRRDGSSRFGLNNRFGNFGALGVGWIFSEERFMQALPFVTFGKLRASYGLTGSDAVRDYSFYSLYSSTGETYQGTVAFRPDALYNVDFVWESTRKLETGLELGLWKNKLGLEVNWYQNRSSNQLVDYPLSTITGFPSVLSNFDALVQNAGWEGVARSMISNSSKFHWSISFNVSFPRNKLVRFKGIEDSPYADDYKVGQPLSIQWLYVYKGLDPQTGLYEFEDINKDGIINNLDRQLMNPTDQKYYGGLNNVIRYKNIELSFLLQYSNQPGFRYLPNFPGSLNSNQAIGVLQRWFRPGDQTDVQRFSASPQQPYTAYSRFQLSNYNQEDASFIRLKTLSISYTPSSRFVNRIKLRQAKFFLQGQNLLTVTSYRGLDPETGNGLPPLRMFTAGIQIKL